MEAYRAITTILVGLLQETTTIGIPVHRHEINDRIEDIVKKTNPHLFSEGMASSLQVSYMPSYLIEARDEVFATMRTIATSRTKEEDPSIDSEMGYDTFIEDCRVALKDLDAALVKAKTEEVSFRDKKI